MVAADDKVATGQLPTACRIPLARAPESAAPQDRPGRERYAWLYDDEDIWAVVEDGDALPGRTAGPRPVNHRNQG